MRTKQLILLTAVASLGAGAFLALGLQQKATWAVGTLCGLAAGLWLLPTGWALWRMHRALQVLQRPTGGNSREPLKTGLRDLDQLAALCTQLRNESVVATQGDARVKLELEELRSFLNQVDRRRTARGPDGQPIPIATQFRGILAGYGRDLQTNVAQVIACGREIGRGAELIVGGADEQTDAVNRTTGHIESLSNQILTIGDNAETTVASSASARQLAANGLSEFQELVDEMKRIRDHVGARERKLQALGQHSKEIGSIVQSIGTLSSRTDLLALNASIESVRAGEHGRGFAIVAEEVRALAEQSAQAVLDITSRIELIQLETQESIAVTSGEHEQIQQVILRVSSALEKLKKIDEATRDCTASVEEISSATKQQLRLMQDIVATLENTAEVSKTNRVQAEGVHWTAKSLEQVAQRLEAALELFRAAGTLTPQTATAPAAPLPAVAMLSGLPAGEAVLA